jgi:hypothetical protein
MTDCKMGARCCPVPPFLCTIDGGLQKVAIPSTAYKTAISIQTMRVGLRKEYLTSIQKYLSICMRMWRIIEHVRRALGNNTSCVPCREYFVIKVSPKGKEIDANQNFSSEA